MLITAARYIVHMIWYGKSKDGRRSVYTVTAPLIAILPLLGIIVAWLIIAVGVVRGCVGG